MDGTKTGSIETISKTCIAVRLRLLNRVVTNLYDDALRPLGLRVSQLNLLVVTAKLGLARPARVCEILQLDASTLSRNVKPLQAHGWLEVVYYNWTVLMNLAEHPNVRRFHESNRPGNAEPPKPLDAAWLRQFCLDSGADDAGPVEISRPALDDQRADILRSFPPAKTLLSFVWRMNRGPIRSPVRSAANRPLYRSFSDT
jgi:hypothetical protein